MATLHSYDYAYIQVVPRVERCEFINAGVILFCRTQRFLAAQIHLDEARLLALAPYLSSATVRIDPAHEAGDHHHNHEH